MIQMMSAPEHLPTIVASKSIHHYIQLTKNIFTHNVYFMETELTSIKSLFEDNKKKHVANRILLSIHFILFDILFASILLDYF